jgi:glucuronoarabinoxylan endo-1,4-beta-xylanase
MSSARSADSAGASGASGANSGVAGASGGDTGVAAGGASGSAAGATAVGSGGAPLGTAGGAGGVAGAGGGAPIVMSPIVDTSAACPAGGGPCLELATKLQSIDGFGAAIAYDVPFVATAASAQFLFSTDNNVSFAGGTYPGIGITLIRVGILPDGTVPSTTWPSVTKALAVNPKILVWGAPWSPTASFKTTGNVTTGSLNTSSYDAWASVLATTFVNSAKSAGIGIYAVSAQNEPDYDTQGKWNMCLYAPADMANFTKVLGPKLHALNPPVKLIAPESECWSCATGYFSAIEGDATALAQTDILAAHDYQYAAQATTVPSGKRLWETEVSFVNQPWDATMTMGIWGAKRIHDNLTTASVNAFHWWWFDNYNATQGLIGGTNPPPKLAFTFGNYSRFVRPGFSRVTVSGTVPTGLDMTAFQAPNGQIVVVIINENSTDNQFTLGLKGGVPAQLTPWVTSATDNLATKTAIPVANDTFAITLPATSVTTLVSP